jgi:enoyl-CoA hydratase/carnithine racemase
MGAAKLTAGEALAFGLIDRIVPADGLPAAVADLTAAALGATPAHIAGIKALTQPA